jgi:putative selenium metabolism hydrolase
VRPVSATTTPPNAPPIDDDSLVEMARRLASTFSVSGNEEAAIGIAADTMRALGFDEVIVDAVGNAVGIMGAGDGPRLLIDGHIDSIPLHSEDQWTVDPFGGTIVDGKLYGLGICDQKSSIAAAAHGVAAERALGAFDGRVAVVASVCEEEMEGCALATAIEHFQPDFVITSEPNDTRLGIGQRGRSKISVRVTGRACHAGHNRLGLNAAEALAALIVEAGTLDHPTHPHLGVRDLTCIDIASWPYPSVSTVPEKAEARFDCRFVPGETEASLLSMLTGCAERAWADWPEQPGLEVALVEASFKTWNGTELSAPEYAAAWWTDEDSHLVDTAKAALTAVGLDPTPTHYSFCTNGSLTAGVLGIPTIGFGVGVESMAHQVDEHVTLDSLRAGARGYASLARHLCGSVNPDMQGDHHG